MRNLILFHILACGMLACTPNPGDGERSSGTVNQTDQSNAPAETRITDTLSGTRDGLTQDQDQMAPADNSQTNEKSNTSGAAGQ